MQRLVLRPVTPRCFWRHGVTAPPDWSGNMWLKTFTKPRFEHFAGRSGPKYTCWPDSRRAGFTHHRRTLSKITLVGRLALFTRPAS